MKKKMLLMLLAVAVCVSMIAAATYAWFTDEADAADAVFTAGTVDIEIGKPKAFDNQKWNNVNPGDSYEVEWNIHNAGSKAMVFKTDIRASWTILEERKGLFRNADNNNETLKNVKIAIWDEVDGEYYEVNDEGYVKTNEWVLRWEGRNPYDKDNTFNLNNFALYYVGNAIASKENKTLRLKVTFDGPNTHNGYQGATFNLGGTATAVQASNGAPEAVFGDVYEGFTYVKP